MTSAHSKTLAKTAGAGWIIAAASFGFMVVQLDVTIVNVALPAMSRDLGGDFEGVEGAV